MSSLLSDLTNLKFPPRLPPSPSKPLIFYSAYLYKIFRAVNCCYDPMMLNKFAEMVYLHVMLSYVTSHFNSVLMISFCLSLS